MVSRISLRPAAATYLCRRLDSHLHPLLRVGRLPIDATEQDHRESADQAREQLKEQGMLEYDGLHPFVEDAWQLLARPPLAVGLAVRSRDGEDFNAVLVEHGRSTIQAYQADGATAAEVREIVLSRHEYGGPVGNAVPLLGDLALASGASVSIPSEKIDEVANRMRGGAAAVQRALASSGLRREDAQVLARAFSGERTLDGAITVRAYDQKVRRSHTLPYNLQFFVSEAGSYLMQRKIGSDGREWFTLAPTDARKVTAKVAEMVRELQVPAYGSA